MSFITDMFNSQKGNGFSAVSAPIISGTNSGQIQDTYNQSQQGLGQQQAFLQALQAQNGIQNQSQVYNQLQQVAAGQGPNPAQAALANATGANTANQAALMASQRGTGQNAGEIARQAAQQGAANQQNAAGQGAALQAQQSLNAIGQAGQMAGQQVGQQAGALNSYNQMAQNQQGIQQGALANYNQANVANTASQNQANAGIAGINAKNQNEMGAGLIKGAGQALMMAADGGGVPNLGVLPQNSPAPSEFWKTHLSGAPAPMSAYGVSPAAPEKSEASQAGETVGKGIGSLISSAGSAIAGGMGMAKGGKVPAMVSPGERYLPPSEVKKVAEGKKSPLKAGEKIPGKPKYKGNDYRNDIVPKTLKEGGIVLPNEVLQSKNPHWAAHDFVSKIMARQGLPTRKIKSKE